MKYAIIIFVFFFCSCNNEKQKFIKKSFYDNGRVKEVAYIKYDTAFAMSYYEDGKLKEFTRTYHTNPKIDSFDAYNILYFNNGHVEREFYYTSHGLNGIHKTYYVTGDLESVGKYINSKKDSVWTFYHKNRTIRKIINYSQNIPNGMEYDFNENGNIRKIYFRNHEGRVAFVRTYLDENNVEEEGFPSGMSYNSDDLALGDTLELFYRIGWLPEWDISISIIEIKPNKGKTILEVNDSKKFIQNGWGRYIETFHPTKEKGSYSWETKINIFDNKLNKEIELIDTFKFVVK